jgi:hypothetical protein
MTHREQARLRALTERDALLGIIDEVELAHAVKDAMRHRVEGLYSACSLAITVGDETVYPTLMTQVEREPGT